MKLKQTQSWNSCSRKQHKIVRQLVLAASVGSAVIAAPQVARAAYIENPAAPNYTASGTETTSQWLNKDNAHVTTAPGFSVDLTPSASGDAVSITGYGALVYEDANGSPLTSITGAGLNVNSYGNDGLGTDGSVSIVTNGVITGSVGIKATNAGSGAVSVTASGNVNANGSSGSGIQASNGASGSSLTVNATNADHANVVTSSQWYGVSTNNNGSGNSTITVDNVTAYQTGIYAQASGSGALSVTSYGNVTSDSGDGIAARINSASNTNTLTIVANNVTGGNNGAIAAVNNGSGSTNITVNGDITGKTRAGIRGTNQGGILTITANDASKLIKGKTYGIESTNTAGSIVINVKSDVIGTDSYGISAGVGNSTTVVNGTNISITAVNVKGQHNAIYTNNRGNGSTEITTSGIVESIAGSGIGANNLALHNSNDLIVNVQQNSDVSGAKYGIVARNVSDDSDSSIIINNAGRVFGGIAGIQATSDNGSAIGITNTGTVFNSAQTLGSLAIQTSGGPVTITNDLVVLGAVNLGASAEGNQFINNFVWDTGGSVNNLDAGGVNGGTITNTGSIMAADFSGGGAVNTYFNGVAVADNAGRIVMQNNIAGDEAVFRNHGNGEYQSNGGMLEIDANFAAGNQKSDVLGVDNASLTGGATTVVINALDDLGAPTNGDGILVVDVNGTSANNAFVLGTSLQAGLFSYDLNQVNNQSWFLQSEATPEAVAAGVLPILGSRAALSSLSNLHDRQRDTKVLSNEQHAGKGVWARVYGQSNEFHSNDDYNFGFDTNLWGAQAGLDLLAKSDGTGNRKYAGLYVAYATSSGDALDGSNKVASLDLDATTLGAYYTKYSAAGWYLDAVAQYSFLSGINAKTASDGISPDGSSYALSLEAGQQFKPQSSIIREVQAQLIYQHTSMDDVTLSDGTQIGLSNLNAVTGRFGVRLYQNPKSGKKFLPWVRANIWHTFANDSQISSLGSSISTPIGGTSGELQAGFTMGPGDTGKWNLYASAGYLFDLGGAEYSGWKGTLGVRKGW